MKHMDQNQGHDSEDRKMNRIFAGIAVIVLLATMTLPPPVQAGTLLQVSAEPGISVWLDNKQIGETTIEQKGLAVRDIAPGEYSARAAREGYLTAERQLVIKEGQTVEWRIHLVKAAMQVEDAVTRVESSMVEAGDFGSVELRSIPLNAKIFFDGKAVGRSDLKLAYVPAAKHSVKFVYQNQELSKKFSLETGEALLYMADFTTGTINGKAGTADSEIGPAVIKMQMPAVRTRKPAAIFPHSRHQEMYSCENCHHGRDAAGNRIPYAEGMKVQHCVACHNPEMMHDKLNNLMQVSHSLCKGCHKKVVAESGTAGPIGKCSGCHTEPVKK